MIKFTLVTGITLILLGIIGYVLTGAQSLTALIPSFFGLLITICGLWSFQENRRKLAMHIAQALALLGFLGSVSGLIKLFGFITGSGAMNRPSAAFAQSIMAVLCLIYLIMGLSTFIKARRR